MSYIRPKATLNEINGLELSFLYAKRRFTIRQKMTQRNSHRFHEVKREFLHVECWHGCADGH